MEWTIGSARITAIYEQPLENMEYLMPDVVPEKMLAVDWLSPHFVDQNGRMIAVIQCFMVEIGNKTLVVDTCVGDGKNLPLVPAWHRATTGFLERFRSAGFDPPEVDAVLCTHMHVDHVGWNTHWDGQVWRPTFPNARYLFSRREFEFWETFSTLHLAEADVKYERPSVPVMLQKTQINVHEDSIQPIFDAGLAELVDPPCELIPGVELFPTPGHTPGHVSVIIKSSGQGALITGDSFHHPCQIAYPAWASIADADQAASHATRTAVLEKLVGTSMLLFGTHFAEPTAGRIVRDGMAFRFDWAR
jgi:glyoxylase-like metal-dependent hydrolase (beta-lactamase superfamily II)